ncbi:MAG: hypothetical protein Q4D12_11510, partial [Bacteroidales bacterium]|nr:hypothetical protein [Bacteroidales bacterium]
AGVDYEGMADEDNSLNKSVTAKGAGDSNSEREYKVDLSSKLKAKGKNPIVMLLQVQTSWQMFDLPHANCVVGDGTYASI